MKFYNQHSKEISNTFISLHQVGHHIYSVPHHLEFFKIFLTCRVVYILCTKPIFPEFKLIF